MKIQSQYSLHRSVDKTLVPAVRFCVLNFHGFSSSSALGRLFSLFVSCVSRYCSTEAVGSSVLGIHRRSRSTVLHPGCKVVMSLLDRYWPAAHVSGTFGDHWDVFVHWDVHIKRKRSHLTGELGTICSKWVELTRT